MFTSKRYSETNDAILISQISAYSDRAAFQQLFQRYNRDLCRYAYVLTRSRDTAEEIVNDVFLKCWKNRDFLQIKSSVQGYLLRATRNMALDRLRAAARRRGKSDELCGDFLANYASPADIMIGQETNRIIQAAVEALSPQRKLIFKMSRDKGMSYNEIAAELELSVKTVEAHMWQTLRLLRERLREQEVLA